MHFTLVLISYLKLGAQHHGPSRIAYMSVKYMSLRPLINSIHVHVLKKGTLDQFLILTLFIVPPKSLKVPTTHPHQAQHEDKKINTVACKL